MTREEVFEAMDLELVSYHQALSARETEELQAAEDEAVYMAEMAAENAWLVHAERTTEDVATAIPFFHHSAHSKRGYFCWYLLGHVS